MGGFRSLKVGLGLELVLTSGLEQGFGVILRLYLELGLALGLGLMLGLGQVRFKVWPKAGFGASGGVK